MLRGIVRSSPLRNRWKVRPPTSASTKVGNAITWGRISARGSACQYDQGVEAKVEGRSRSTNHAAPRGLLRGFAYEEQAPPLPSSSKK